MRVFLVALLCIALAFAGCLTKDKDADPEGPSSSSSDSSSDTGSSTSTSGSPVGNASNHAPQATLEAAGGNASAGLTVTFRLNATDADGDALNWTLSFGDDQANETGSSFPANVTHAYAAGGAYNATLWVTDGVDTTNVTLALNLTAGTPFEQFVASGTPDLACPQCSVAGANTGAGYRSGTNELDSWFVEIPAGAVGQTFVLTSESGDADMVFRDSCASSGAAVGESFTADGDETGTVPEGATCVLAWNPADVVAKITLTIG